MMRHSFFRNLIVVLGLAYSLASYAQHTENKLKKDDDVLLDSAINLMDHGHPKDAIKIIDKIRKEYDNNYVVEYERLFAYYKTGDLKRIVKEGPKLFNHPDADSNCYQLVGNAQDVLGDPATAIKTYDEGIKRFPNAGNLYLEKGNIYMAAQNYEEALKYYMQGVKAQPDFASNYYRLAKLYAVSTEPLWAVFYGEVVCNLLPGSERCAEMGKLIYDVFNENIKVESNNKIRVTMTDENTINTNSSFAGGQLPFSRMYEMGLMKNPNIAKDLLKTKKLTIKQIAEMRRNALDFVDSLAQDLSTISLLDYHRKLIKSGHWTAYNMWLMASGAPEEVDHWINNENDAQLEQFVSWADGNPFVPSKEKPTIKVFNTNGLNIPDIEEIQTADDCRAHREDALRLAKWYLEQPANPNDAVQKEVAQFILCWMTKTDEVLFSITSGTPLCEGVFAAYMASMAKYAIESNVRKTDESMHCEVMLQVIDYYKRNKNTLGSIESMEKYLKMDDLTLRETLAYEYKRSIAK